MAVQATLECNNQFLHSVKEAPFKSQWMQVGTRGVQMTAGVGAGVLAMVRAFAILGSVGTTATTRAVQTIVLVEARVICGTVCVRVTLASQMLIARK